MSSSAEVRAFWLCDFEHVVLGFGLVGGFDHIIW
jgi:hypothetical protein